MFNLLLIVIKIIKSTYFTIYIQHNKTKDDFIFCNFLPILEDRWHSPLVKLLRKIICISKKIDNLKTYLSLWKIAIDPHTFSSES